VQSSVEAYLFLLGAPFVAFGGVVMCKWRFEQFDGDKIALTSPFMVHQTACCKSVVCTVHELFQGDGRGVVVLIVHFLLAPVTANHVARSLQVELKARRMLYHCNAVPAKGGVASGTAGRLSDHDMTILEVGMEGLFATALMPPPPFPHKPSF
jgi:hypothetical protein